MQQTRYQYGDPQSQIAFIAEAPGKTEMQDNRPLTGPSGNIFDLCLMNAGLSKTRHDKYIGNVGRNAISSGYVLFNERKGQWTQQGQEEYDAFTARLRDVNSNVFVALGNISLFALTGQMGIKKYRGSILPCSVPGLEDRKVIPTYHPAYTMRGQSVDRHNIVLDFARAKREMSTRDIPGIGGQLISHPEFDYCMAFLDACEYVGTFSHDTETYNGHVSCMSFAYRGEELGEAYAICIPFYDSNRPERARWTVKQEIQLWTRIASLLTNPNVTIIGQNYLFDMWVMAWKSGVTITAPIEDAMVAHSIMYPDLLKGLDYLCSVYTNIPYYKDDVKLWDKLDDGFQDTFWEYSAKDALATLLVWERVGAAIRKDHEHLETYRRTIALYPALLYMQQRGIPFDVAALPRLRKEAESQLDNLQGQLDATADYSFNPNSTKQAAEYFYGYKGLKLYKSKTGGVSTDNDALRRIYLRDKLEEARICQEYRSTRKFIGDSLGVIPDPDGRMRCSINPRGTKFGRLSTSKTVFGTGTNMQNREVRFKELLHPDPGYAFFEFDLAGAEWVVVAYLSKDQRMIDVCNGNESPHVVTAQAMFNVPADVIRAEDKELGHVTSTQLLNEGRQKYFPELVASGVFLPRSMTLRQAGKRSNHGLNYDLGYRSFATKNDMSEVDARRIHTQYRRIYDLETYHGDIRRELKDNNRTLVNLLGRKQRFLGSLNDETYKAAYSFKPQSTIVDLMNGGIRNVWNDEWLVHWEPLMQVHDSCLYQHRVSSNFDAEDWYYRAREVKSIIKHITQPLTVFGRTFTIPVELKVSKKDWYHMKEIDVTGSIDEIAEKLEQILG